MFEVFSIAGSLGAVADVGRPLFQATLRGETFGIGATEGTVGADAAAMVMLTLFLFLLSLILLVARGLANRAANPLPELALLEEMVPNGTEGSIHPDATTESNSEDFPEDREPPPTRGVAPWEKPDDWWRKISQ